MILKTRDVTASKSAVSNNLVYSAAPYKRTFDIISHYPISHNPFLLPSLAKKSKKIIFANAGVLSGQIISIDEQKKIS